MLNFLDIHIKLQVIWVMTDSYSVYNASPNLGYIYSVVNSIDGYSMDDLVDLHDRC